MDQRARTAREIQAAIGRVLLTRWDPIGVADVSEASSEYDAYVGRSTDCWLRELQTTKSPSISSVSRRKRWALRTRTGTCSSPLLTSYGRCFDA